jgi:transposase
LYRDLVELGYTGSYDRVAAFARQWRQGQQEARHLAGKQAYVPLQFAPGEAFQFDWSEDWVRINGVSTKLQIAHFKLSFSRAFFMHTYLTQSHEMLFDAHHHAFSAFGGVPERGIYDNMKTAVDKIGRGKQHQVNKRFYAMVGHYLFEPAPCATARRLHNCRRAFGACKAGCSSAPVATARWSVSWRLCCCTMSSSWNRPSSRRWKSVKPPRTTS